METIKENEKQKDYFYRKITSLNKIKDSKNNILLSLKQQNKNNKSLNKDIMHLINSDDNYNKNDIKVEKDIKFDFNSSNKNISLILPYIKMNDIIINSNSSSYINLRNNKINLKINSTSIGNIGNTTYKGKNPVEKLTKKHYNKTSAFNFNKVIPNLKINKNIIKRNICINKMKTINIINKKNEDKKLFDKEKLVKNKDILEKIQNKNQHHLNNIHLNQFLKNSYNNIVRGGVVSNNIIKNKRIKNNYYNLRKNNSMTNLFKLDDCYINMKLKDTMKQIDNRYKANKDLNKKNFLNNSSIKNNIFNYHEIIARFKRINALEKIKQKNKMFIEFHNNVGVGLKNQIK